jgi:hypothetical protein
MLDIKNDIVDIDEADKWLNQAVAEESTERLPERQISTMF